MARSLSSSAVASSSTLNAPEMLASSGKRRRSAAAKACSVDTLRPPGVSSDSAKRVRARWRGGGGVGFGRQRGDPLAELGFGQRGEGGELLVDAARHLGRGGVGVGEAEDRAGRDAREQEPHHALREDVGLPCAGVGGDPDGRGRVARPALRRVGLGGNAQPCHSLTLARWS